LRLARLAIVMAASLELSGAAVADPLEDADSVDQTRYWRIISPHIEGDTLIIEGKIDSHIYDYLMYEAGRIAAVKMIELNSLGGPRLNRPAR
jgi:hypothetical protein